MKSPGGETIEHGPWRVVVRKVRRKKVQEAQVSQITGKLERR